MKTTLIAPLIGPLVTGPLEDDITNTNPSPAPPGPLDRLLPGDAALVDYTTAYNSATGIIVVRIAFVNNEDGVPDIQATWDGAAMTRIGLDCASPSGSPGVCAFYIRGGSTGTKNIHIVCNSGSAGGAALRIGDLLTLDATTPIGVVGTTTQGLNYYVEVDSSSGTYPGNSLIASVVCFDNGAAFPISASYSDIEQWNTEQNVMAGRFAYAPSPSGEPGLNLYVFYSYLAPALQTGAAMIFELHGATVP